MPEYIELGKRSIRRQLAVWISIGNMTCQLPIAQMVFYPGSEFPVPDMRTCAAAELLMIAGVDDYIGIGCAEKHTHVLVKHGILDQVVDDIQ